MNDKREVLVATQESYPLKCWGRIYNKHLRNDSYRDEHVYGCDDEDDDEGDNGHDDDDHDNDGIDNGDNGADNSIGDFSESTFSWF